ncbi:double homeobox protein 4C-like [Rhineura floridana]|uniref:double homeobox protein 4C-like n=1 Tax=Rhineura floridana TaxID=261503 RepID=UPI002AC818A8|nr:double homeobox protein 4C-like [Rhineura floridana]
MKANNPGSRPKPGRGERRQRTVYTKEQLELLIDAFEKDRYAGYETRVDLATTAGVPESRVHVWFQNRRARLPKAPHLQKKPARRRAAAAPSGEASCPGRCPHPPVAQGSDFSYPGREGALWQPPDLPVGAPQYAWQDQNSPAVEPFPFPQAAVGGTGACDAAWAGSTTSGSSNTLPYCGGPLPSELSPPGESLYFASSSDLPWTVMGSDQAGRPLQRLRESYPSGQHREAPDAFPCPAQYPNSFLGYP